MSRPRVADLVVRLADHLAHRELRLRPPGEARLDPVGGQVEHLAHRETLKNDVYISYRSSIYQYLMERRGRIPVFSGMSGKIQLELGLSGYLGIKCRF